MLAACFNRTEVPRLSNPTGYLKNYWIKHRLVCIHFDAFSMLIPNMDMKINNFEIFDFFSENVIL